MDVRHVVVFPCKHRVVDDSDRDDDDDSSLGFKIHFEDEANAFKFIAVLSNDKSLINQQKTSAESHDFERDSRRHL
jgi:hypothetical protein